MIKVIAIGDVHGRWPVVWRALIASGAATSAFEPSDALLAGRIRVVLLGDLVHYKRVEAYADAIGEARYDVRTSAHLVRAARAQIRELERVRAFAEVAGAGFTVVLGNHDDAVLHREVLASGSALNHPEFCVEHGGMDLPDTLRAWFLGFPRSVETLGVHFAHAGPTPSLQTYDAYFYNDQDTKRWWYEKPTWVRDMGYRLGVYGHTPMPDGVWVDEAHGIAMIDALELGEYVEVLVDPEQLSVRIGRA